MVAAPIQRIRCKVEIRRSSTASGKSTLAATMIRFTKRGITSGFPALKPRQPDSAVSGALERAPA
jgi:hypothetical protein